MKAYINGARVPFLEKLTPAMWEMLYALEDSDSSGSHMTRRALVNRKLISRSIVSASLSGRQQTEYVWGLTEVGKAAVAVEWRAE